MKRAVLLALCTVSFMSCGEPQIEPATGTWGIAFSAPTTNTCGDAVDFSSGDFGLTNNGDGTFTVDPKDGSATFDCTVDGERFTCPERVLRSTPLEGYDATLELRVSETGTFSANTEASGRRDGSATCTGSACALAPTIGLTFPCDWSASFTASHKS